MSEIKEGKWIKSSNRLPALTDKGLYKISEYVLGFGAKDLSHFETYHIVRLREDNNFYTNSGEQIPITHWTPVPEKPEEYKR